jgi:hypothetical protein
MEDFKNWTSINTLIGIYGRSDILVECKLLPGEFFETGEPKYCISFTNKRDSETHEHEAKLIFDKHTYNTYFSVNISRFFNAYSAEGLTLSQLP